MARGTPTVTTTLALLLPIGAVALLTAGRAEAATPTYYNNLPAFQADITLTVTDDYSNPGYVFIQNNAAMSAVLGETYYTSTGFLNHNIVSGGYYCAGCNGSFELSFQTTSVGNAVGVNGVGVYLQVHSLAVPYYAYITFGDGTTANIALPAAGQFWGVAAPERIESIHFGLSMGGTTQAGSFGIDNLIVGDGNIGTCVVDADCVDDLNPCTDPVCNAGVCGVVNNVAPCDDGNACTDESCIDGACVPQFNTAPCDDEEVCTENDVCSVGFCQGTLVDCNDGNPCTTNFCAFGEGCDMVNNTDPCDDGNACTELDVCAAGACGGAVVNCSDDDVCTMDSCDPAVGCSSEAVGGCCVGDEDCPAGEVCDEASNTCMPGASGSSDGGMGESSDGGPGSTSAPGETGVDGTGDGESGVGSDAGGAETGLGSSSGADTGTGAEGGQDPTPDPSGCACTTDPSQRSGAWWMVAAGFGLLLRRRRRAA